MLENPTFFDILLLGIGTFLTLLVTVFMWIKMSKETSSLEIKNIIIGLIIMLISISTMTIFMPKSIRMIFTILVLVSINYLFFSKNIKNAIINVAISQFIIMFSEFIFIILSTVLIKGGIDSLAISSHGNLIINSFITLISFIMFIIITNFKTSIITIKSAENIQKRELFTSISLLFTLAIITTAASHLRWASIYVLTINMIIVFIFIVLMLKFMNTKNNLDSISNKYETSITSLKEYETLINKNRINNHENKNQLLIIRSMLVDKTKKDKVIDYIDKLVDDKIKDNEKIMYKTAKIPEGGLRATIYSKLCKMDDLKIKYNLDISNDIRTADLIDLGDELTLNICKILGVFLDNAIEAVEHLRKKTIRIEIYIMDGNIHIEITNNFKGPIDIESIGKTGYTTKNGDNHGYGLSLVKQIIDENKHILENKTEINKDNFSQTLIIKM